MKTAIEGLTVFLAEEDLGHLEGGGEFVSEHPQKTGEILALLDLNMPVMDGKEVVERLKAEEKMKALPVIILKAQKC